MIVTMGSIRGSPGATSWALLLAAAWPSAFDVDRVVIEADLDGGVLGARYGFGVDPGVVSFIAALRRSDADGRVEVSGHGRAMGGGVWVVPGPETGEQARAVWAGTAEGVAARLAADDRLWVVDVGRIGAGSPTLPLVRRATLAVVVSRSSHEDFVQVPTRVGTLHDHVAQVGVIVVGKSAHQVDDLSAFFGTGLIWMVGASDELREVAGAALVGGRARRSWLWRTAVNVAADVAGHVNASPDAASNGDVEAPVASRTVTR